jgi:hypothetical protein
MVEAYEETGSMVAPWKSNRSGRHHGVLDVESVNGPTVKAKGMVESAGRRHRTVEPCYWPLVF